MKTKIISIIFCCLFIATTLLQAQTIAVSGSISSNSVWQADTIKITGDITVGKGITLTVAAGTYIEAQGYYKIVVQGSIRAIGTETDSIVFTTRDTANFWKDSLSVAGGWGGIRLSNSMSLPDTSIFQYCKLQYGKKYDVYGGDTKGGAIYAGEYGMLFISNSCFTSNIVNCDTSILVNGALGAAVYCTSVNNVQIVHNRFEKNRSYFKGGAIHIEHCGRVVISYNVFKQNIAGRWRYALNPNVRYYGPLISSTSSIEPGTILSNNYIFNNLCGICIESYDVNGLIFNNVICNNLGTGIQRQAIFSQAKIFNNTIANNYCFWSGIIISANTSSLVYNNICWGNKLDSLVGLVDQIEVSQASGSTKLFNNCVQKGEGGTDATYSDPEFVNPTTGAGLGYDGSKADWSLKNSSPCINQGTLDTTGLFIPNFDILRNTRVYGKRVDIGAIENQTMVVGTEENESIDNMVTISPNPGCNHILIKITQPANAIFVMYDMLGKPVIKQPLTGPVLRISTQSLPSHMYTWQIISKGIETESGKWIKIQK